MAFSGKFQLEADTSVGSNEVQTALLLDDLTLSADKSILANASAGPKRHTRREEITGILQAQTTDSLSLRDKQRIGDWLSNHFERLKTAAPDGGVLNKDDIIGAYSSAQWSDKSKFLWSDMRMLKRVASHFDEIALGGEDAQTIESGDIDALKRGGTVKRTAKDVTTTYPDGDLERRTKDGVLFKKGADGSMSFDSAIFKLELAANGHGYLRYNLPEGMNLGENSNEIKLTRNDKGIWSGKMKDGEDLELALDEHSVRMQSPSMDMLLTTTGGFFRDPADPESTAFINPDGSISMTENGKAVTIGANIDNGVVMAVDSEGGRVVQYPGIGVEYWDDGKGSAGVKGGEVLPDVRAEADGSLKVFRKGAEPLTAQANPDGKAEITLQNGLNVMHEKDGKFTFGTSAVDESGNVMAITIDITADGTFTLRAPDGGTAELKPPQLRRPPGIR